MTVLTRSLDGGARQPAEEIDAAPHAMATRATG
jgi:hypothetical protein